MTLPKAIREELEHIKATTCHGCGLSVDESLKKYLPFANDQGQLCCGYCKTPFPDEED